MPERGEHHGDILIVQFERRAPHCAVKIRRWIHPLQVNRVGDDAQLGIDEWVLLAQLLGKARRGNDDVAHPAEYPGLDRCVKAMVEPAKPGAYGGSPGRRPAEERAMAEMDIG